MNEDLQTGELTFQKVFEVLKRSFVRILIYALVLAILGGGITAIVTIANKGSSEYKTIIEYNYSGIVSGEDPLGNMLDTNTIKSTVVVNNALKNMGITDDNVVLAYSQIIINNLSVIGIVPPQIADELKNNSTFNYFPARYTISLTEDPDLHFRDTDYLEFLNELINSYKLYFKDTYNYGKVLSLSIADAAIASANDYYDLCLDYRFAIKKLLSELATLKNNVPERYNKLYSNIDMLNNEIKNIENYVIANNVSKPSAPMTLKNNIDAKIGEYTIQGTSIRAEADAMKLIIDDYINQSSKTTTDGGLVEIISTESKNYDVLVNKYLNLRSSETSYSNQVALLTEQSDMVGVNPATEQQIANVESWLLAFDNSINNTLKAANTELELYSNNNVTENGVKVAMNATKTQVINYSLIIIVAIVCGFVGCLVAIAISEVRYKRFKSKAKTL